MRVPVQTAVWPQRGVGAFAPARGVQTFRSGVLTGRAATGAVPRRTAGAVTAAETTGATSGTAPVTTGAVTAADDVAAAVAVPALGVFAEPQPFEQRAAPARS